MAYIIGFITIVLLFFVAKYLKKECREVISQGGYIHTVVTKDILLVYNIYEGVNSHYWSESVKKYLCDMGYTEKGSGGKLRKGLYSIGRERRESDTFYTTRSETLRVVCNSFVDYESIKDYALSAEREHRESQETLRRREEHTDKLRSSGYF